MSKTIDGYYFTCKSCGKTHFYSKRPCHGIRLPCANDKYDIQTYYISDFKNYWNGNYEDVRDIIVGEDC